ELLLADVPALHGRFVVELSRPAAPEGTRLVAFSKTGFALVRREEGGKLVGEFFIRDGKGPARLRATAETVRDGLAVARAGGGPAAGGKAASLLHPEVVPQALLDEIDRDGLREETLGRLLQAALREAEVELAGYVPVRTLFTPVTEKK